MSFAMKLPAMQEYYSLAVWMAFGAVVLYILTFPGRRGRHLPPGPPTLPIIGNLHQMPTRKAYIKLAEWAEQYGDMYSLKIGSTTTIVLSNRALCKEVLERRNAISSGRPPAYALSDLVYRGDFLLLMHPSDPRYRLSRKLLHQFFGDAAIDKGHLKIINAEAAQLLRDLMLEPDRFPDHAQRFANSFIMSVNYGVRTPSVNTPHLKHIAHINEVLGALVVPGRLPPVDIFRFLKLLPERFLGHWVTECIDARKASDDLYGSLIQMVMDRRKRSGPGKAYADQLIDNKEYKFTLHELMYLTGGVLDAGTDTTASVIVTLIQMLCAFPETIKKAQQQIDAVVGEDRTPVWDDFDKLPIINQLMKETQRIRPVTPISFPHQMLEDTWVDGKLIPKGATIITNLTTIHNDARKFQQPDIFNPEHYVDKPKLSQKYANAANPEDRDHYTYGFGRRICSGMYIAERSLFTSFSKLLWAFDITAPTDDAGKPIPVDMDHMTGYTDGIIVLPKPFKANIKVRSEKRRQTILKEFDAAGQIFAEFELPLMHETA